ncbi:MAG: hypothetical protein U0325_01190 [Polyangiales bacterium]
MPLRRPILVALTLAAACAPRPRPAMPAPPTERVASDVPDARVDARGDAGADAATGTADDAHRARVLAEVREALAAAQRAAPAGLTWIAGPWVVRERGLATPRLAALVGLEGRAALVSVGQTSDAPPTRWCELGLRGDARDTAAVFVRDVDRDGTDEVIVVARDEPVREGIPLQARATVYTIDTSLGPSWVSLDRIGLALAGDTDEAGVDVSLVRLGHDEPPHAGTVPARFVARLVDASPAGFRAVIDPRGLRVCDPGPRGRSVCRTLAAAGIADAEVARLQRRYVDLVERGGTDPPGVSLQSCQRAGDAVTCGGSHYTQNYGLSWTVRGEGAAMRLVEVRYTSSR